MSVADTYLRPESKVLRAIFLFVGQGESTLLLIPDGNGGHRSMLVDCNRAPGLRGIDLPRLLKALPGDGKKPRLDLFVNTHPHLDHLCGIDEIRSAVDIQEVWHSGHKPGKDNDGPYQELVKLTDWLAEQKRPVVQLEGSRTPVDFAEAKINVLAPASYVTEDIEGEDADGRYRRIHEQCAVLRICYGTGAMRGILVTGDSDKTAWKEHLAYHHAKDSENRVAASILSASHHGSRTFFKDTEDDEDVYKAHLTAIAPEHVIISAPDRKDSPHEHPHEDALALYEEHVGKVNVHHMGSSRRSFILDVFEDGSYDLYEDHGDLAEEFGLEPPEDDDGGSKNSAKRAAPAFVIPRVERSLPMGSNA